MYCRASDRIADSRGGLCQSRMGARFLGCVVGADRHERSGVDDARSAFRGDRSISSLQADQGAARRGGVLVVAARHRFRPRGHQLFPKSRCARVVGGPLRSDPLLAVGDRPLRRFRLVLRAPLDNGADHHHGVECSRSVHGGTVGRYRAWGSGLCGCERRPDDADCRAPRGAPY